MSSISREEYGGKGAGLMQLRAAGFEVPEFEVLGVSFFKSFDRKDPKVKGQVAAHAATKLVDWQSRPDGYRFAVRSSAPVEDSSTHSFAGQFTTLLNVDAHALPEAVADVWLSAGTADSYARATAIVRDTRMAVVIQVMVSASASGVAFSADPVTGAEGVIVNAVAGLGDKLVDGSVSGDTFRVLPDQTIEAQLQDASGGAVLSDEQILQVDALAKQAHALFGGPQDIEFAFAGGRLYALQARPITTLPSKLTTWDNSNIVESYPGLTLPLTFTFIEKMYESVYRQFTALLGVPEAKIERHGAAFANMLGSINGRVYYNLNSWYEALSLLPGYELNAAFMERMMGVKEKPDIEIAPDGGPGLKAWWNVLRGVSGILRNLHTARQQAIDFERAFDKVYAKFSGQLLEKKSLPELWAGYCEFETLMLREWKAPLVNDFFAMIYFGLLQQQCAGIPGAGADLHNRLLAGSDAVLTTQPMKDLPAIAAAIRADAALQEIALNGTAAGLVDALAQPEHRDAGTLFDAYVDVWGERAVAELKLETITYQQEPALLAGLLQSYLQHTSDQPPRAVPTGTDRLAAEADAAAALRGKWLKKRLFSHVLRNARYFVSQRENLRYYRTRGFGMVRRMMLLIGQRLAAAGAIAAPRDVFWLELDEVGQLALSAAPEHMDGIIGLRKAQYRSFEANPLPQRIRTYGKPKGLIGKTAAKAGATTGDILQGTPCSAGIVRAPVRLVTYSDSLRSLDGALLATYATDPGFVVLFASASGILTERGSLLSHAAIVSREMGIPCIVGIEGLMDRLQDGDIVEMDGSTGTLRIIRSERQGA